LALPPGPADVGARLRQSWFSAYLPAFLHDRPDLRVLRVLDTGGAGPGFGVRGGAAEAALDAAFEQARRERAPAYRFAAGASGEPMAALAAPVEGAGGGRVIVEGLLKLRAVQEAFRGEARQGFGVFLIDRRGKLLWSNSGSAGRERALQESDVVRAFVRRPLTMTSQYTAVVGGRRQEMLAEVSAVEESGWGLVVQKPVDVAFAVVNQMVVNTILSTFVLVLLACVFALSVAKLVSLPIQRLAETSHEIAAGNFSRRVEAGGLGSELAELADDFNRMS